MDILVVVDMQKDFVDGALGTPEAQAIVGKVTDKILGFDGQIFATLDTHREDYLDTAEGKKLPVPHCIKGTPGWMLDSGVAAALEQKGYTPVEKLTFGSVLLPRLLYQAAAGETLTMELVGLCTDICVVSNALLLKAAMPEVEITVDAAALAESMTNFGFDRALYGFEREGFAAIRDAYKARCVNLGRHVTFDGGEGTALDVDEGGRLVVQGAEGSTHVFTGEVSVHGIYGAV